MRANGFRYCKKCPTQKNRALTNRNPVLKALLKSTKLTTMAKVTTVIAWHIPIVRYKTLYYAIGRNKWGGSEYRKAQKTAVL